MCLRDCAGRLPERAVIHEESDPEHDNRVWLIERAGEDLLRRLDGVRESAFLCYLNLRSDGADGAYRALVERGFRFAGLKPLNENGEYLLMASGALKDSWTETLCIDEPGQWLIEYIMRG